MSKLHRSALVQELAQTPERLAALVAALPADSLATKPSPAEFSAREHVHHLRDLDAEAWSVRLERLLVEDGPEMAGIDGDRLARERRYNERGHEQALSELMRLRSASVARLQSLADADWIRAGTLESAGRVTVERLAEIWLEHDRGHLGDLEALARRGVTGAPRP